MKEVFKATHVWMPGADEWEWWRKRPTDPVAIPSERPTAGIAAVFALPAHQCSSVPVWVSSADPQIIEQVLDVELERLGVKVADVPGTHLAWQVAGTEGNRCLVRAVVVPPELDPQGSKEDAAWERFLPSPLMLPPRSRTIVLWQEAERWVVGFGREERWIHFQSLGRRQPDVPLLQDIQCLALELDGRRMVDRAEALVLWKAAGNAPVPDDFGGQVARVLNLDFRILEKPAPDPKLAEGYAFEPGVIAERRRRKEQNRRLIQVAGLVAMIFGILVGIGSYDLHRRQESNRELRHRVREREPEAGAVREARSRWEVMESALEVDRYPVELFFQVARLFPSQGLRMTSFEITEGGQIVVRGEASSVPVAIRFKADLEGNSDLKDYDWEIPPPENIGEVAEFVAFGTYRFSVTAVDGAMGLRSTASAVFPDPK